MNSFKKPAGIDGQSKRRGEQSAEEFQYNRHRAKMIRGRVKRLAFWKAFKERQAKKAE